LATRAVSGEIPSAIGYTPPTPGYAISPVEPIPKGYVAHARDACVDTDFQWDSMREPLLWGDGGIFGEEWSAMHKRFRKGLMSLVDWYDKHPHGNEPDDHEAVPAANGSSSDHDDDEENVIVLLTHGAGCNALVGALTEQPVLIDFGMASMTMAARRDDSNAKDEAFSKALSLFRDSSTSPDMSDPARRGSMAGMSINTGLSDLYELKITASLEHLRPGSDPSRPNTPIASSPNPASSKTNPDSRRRSTLASHSAAGSPLDTTWSISEHPRNNTSTALGSIRRLSTQNPQPMRSGSVSSVASMTGLWTPSTPPLAEGGKEDDDNKTPVADKRDSPVREVLTYNNPPADNKLGISYVPDRSVSLGTPGSAEISSPARSASTTEDPNAIPRISHTMASPRRGDESGDEVSDLPSRGVSAQVPMGLNRTLSQKGLWGSTPSGAQERTPGPKRRWTLLQE